MIAFIKGVVQYKDADKAILESSGIGYELSMSTQALASLPATGNVAQVWTYLHVKDDDISLFGFSDISEKELFTRLITVSGIGPKMAISALSTFKAAELISLIAAGDVTAVSKIPGVGKKTAQRMILELQGVLTTDDSLNLFAPEGSVSQSTRDAARALESMGFSSDEVTNALKGCTENDVSSIIRYALKNLGGAA